MDDSHHAVQVREAIEALRRTRMRLEQIDAALHEKFRVTTRELLQEKEPTQPAHSSAQLLDFSLFFFSSDESQNGADKYRLVLDAAKFADRNGFKAVWLPERHFHRFGGLYPNPATLGAALATVTKNIRIRAGSVVLPLHHPVRVAEEWSVVDNLSGGRVDLAFTKGWHPNDFVVAPQRFERRQEEFLTSVRQVQSLWRGESSEYPNGKQELISIRSFPRPRQSGLPTWITCTKRPESFVDAGAIGANVLTAVLTQSFEELEENIRRYRAARVESGFDPAEGKVTVMLHTLVGDSETRVREIIRGPFRAYLESSVELWSQGVEDLKRLSDAEKQRLLDFAVERYVRTGALFGTPESCRSLVERLQEMGVTEIACLIDFGVDAGTVLASLPFLKQLQVKSQSLQAHQIVAESRPLPMNRPTPSPFPGGEPATGASNEAPLLGGAWGGFMVPMRAQSEWRLPMNRKDGFPAVQSFGGWKASVPGSGEQGAVEARGNLPRNCEPINLFCFPYAGGKAKIFRSWTECLPNWVHLQPIELPDADNELDEILDSLTAALRPRLEQPFMFYGHSMGGLFAFELARRLVEKGERPPDRLLIGAQHAPHLPFPFPDGSEICSEQGWKLLESLAPGLHARTLQRNPALGQRLLRPLMSAVRFQQSYRFRNAAPLPCPITVFFGKNDPVLTRDQLQGWSEHTGREFQLHEIAAGHLFVQSAASQICRIITDELSNRNRLKRQE